MSNVTDRMGTEPIPSILFKMSLPAVIAMFVQAVYNMVDRLFVGMYVQNAEDALAGVGVGFPIFLILIGVGMLVGMGGSAIFSISLGAKQDERAEKVLGTSILTMIIVSVAVGALGYIFLPQILNAIGAAVPYETGRPAEIIQAERIFDFGMDYYQIILLGSPLMAIGFGINSFIRAEGNTFRAMINMLAGALTNILLDWIFLAFLGWGIEGAALATVISQGVTALLVMEHFLFDRSKVRFHWKNLLILPKEILSIFAIGSSGFLMQSAAAAMNGLLNNQIRTFGELANQGLNPEQLAQGSYVAAGLSAMGIIYPVGMMILMPIFGLNQGAQPILGYNFGAKKPERVRQTVLLSIVFSTGILVLGFLAFQWFAPPNHRAFCPRRAGDQPATGRNWTGRTQNILPDDAPPWGPDHRSRLLHRIGQGRKIPDLDPLTAGLLDHRPPDRSGGTWVHGDFLVGSYRRRFGCDRYRDLFSFGDL
jgi:Na+-driven multidrug efflux pump